MSHKNEEVHASVERVKSAAEKFFQAPPPNEEITELNYTKLKELAAEIPNLIENSDKNNLISNINKCIEAIGLPEFEHGVASRGLLIAKVQGLELLNNLQEAKIMLV